MNALFLTGRMERIELSSVVFLKKVSINSISSGLVNFSVEIISLKSISFEASYNLSKMLRQLVEDVRPAILKSFMIIEYVRVNLRLKMF